MANLAQGDLGRSLLSGKPVAQELAYHAAFTLQLGVIGWLLSYLIALPLGILAGFRPGGVIDRATDALAVTLASLPSSWSASGSSRSLRSPCAGCHRQASGPGRILCCPP